jgi:predicted exporter/SAM-dependent methyltransferase
MSFGRYKLRWSIIALVVLAVAGLFWAGLQRLTFDTDIAASLPQDDPVLADARRILAHHPISDRVVIDVSLPRADRDGLVAAAEQIEERLQQSGLFRRVGLGREQQQFPDLIFSLPARLPVLFTAAELDEKVKPLLHPDRIRERLAAHLAQLGRLDAIGQTELIAADPLSLRDLILSRLSHLAPTRNAEFYKGQLISGDQKHLLIIAEPLKSGTDTTFARQATALIDAIGAELNRERGQDQAVTLTPVGAYRAALDNETSSKEGTQRAVLFSAAAIVFMLLVAFPRPLIGLLALLPSVVGTMLAFFVYSLFTPAITMMAVGFGGAILSFTVDYGIAYLLFLDRSHETSGRETTREVWSLGLLSMLTTAASFAFLAFSGFAALAQIGAFTALGVVFTFCFVHLIYPVVFPVMPPARRGGFLPVQALANKIASSRGMTKVYAAIALGVVMLFFAKPVFHVDLNAMNAVSEASLAAEKQVGDVWGNLFGRIYVMVEGSDLPDLQRQADRMAERLDHETGGGVLSSAFSPAFIFPGAERSAQNLQAWRDFWMPERIRSLQDALQAASRELGFSPDAFAPFLDLAATRSMDAPPMPEAFFGLMGVSQSRDGTFWLQVSTLTPGPAYSGEAFYDRFKSAGTASIFDPGLFTKRLADAMLAGFIKMAAMVGIVTIVVTFLYLLDWRLTLLGLLPTLFSLICTLGTLNLLGQPLGIPTIMVAVIVIGMGTDYAFYLVRAHQHYRDEDSPSLGLIRLTVLLSAATTFMGFGVLAFSGNALLKSAGVTIALGIGYSFLGAVTIAPPLLRRLLLPAPWPEDSVAPGSPRRRPRTLKRYRYMDAHPRLFARFKLLIDPLFARLDALVSSPRRIIDIGCGYGVPAVWLLCRYPQAKVFGIDPDPKRVNVARQALGDRGTAEVGGAPDLPAAAPEKVDTALMLDMIHLISEDALRLTLKRLHERLEPEGRLIIRATVPSRASVPWLRRIEEWRLRAAGLTPHYRKIETISAFLRQGGFAVEAVEPEAGGREEVWFVAVHAGESRIGSGEGADIQTSSRRNPGTH